MSKGERRKRERERGREKGRKETKGQVVKDIVCDEWPLNLTALFQVFKIVVLSLCGNRSEGMLCDCPMLGWSGGAAGQFRKRYFGISPNLHTHKYIYKIDLVKMNVNAQVRQYFLRATSSQGTSLQNLDQGLHRSSPSARWSQL